MSEIEPLFFLRRALRNIFLFLLIATMSVCTYESFRSGRSFFVPVVEIKEEVKVEPEVHTMHLYIDNGYIIDLEVESEDIDSFKKDLLNSYIIYGSHKQQIIKIEE